MISPACANDEYARAYEIELNKKDSISSRDILTSLPVRSAHARTNATITIFRANYAGLVKRRAINKKRLLCA